MIKHQDQQRTPWLIGLALVKFDFDEGQLVQQIYPPVFSKPQQKTIAMLSFPDSNSFDANQGILKYIFRMKRANQHPLFGFVCFKQRKDSTIFRGYFQKSFVILSELPLLSFFSTLSEFLVFRLFGQDSEKLGLEKIYKEIQEWSVPEPFCNLQLNILNYTFKVNLPTFKKQHCLEQYKTKKILKIQNFHQIGHFQQTRLVESFKRIVPMLWTLWELVLLNKPIMVVGDTPAMVSNSVLGIISLISPLEYVSDYKPYMTVYDDDFHVIQKSTVQNPSHMNIIIGVTNPLFLKTLRKFPNILSLLNNQQNKGLTSRIRNDPQLCKLLKDMQESKQSQEIIQGLIRRHFRKLTEMFMEQFELYFLQQKNDLKQYKKEDFIKFIKSQKVEFGECFESKRVIVKLYSEFCDSLNFHRFLLSRNVIKTF